MTITEAQMAADLARLPPPPSSAGGGGKLSSPLRELALVLVHQQCRALLGMGEKDHTARDQLLQLSAELAASSQQQQHQQHQHQQPEGGQKGGSAQGFCMAEALDEEGEEDEEVDKETYLRVLRAHKALPVSVQLQCAEFVGASKSQSGGGGADSSEHQSMRDVERDQLSLDGCLYRAGSGGYARVLHWLRSAMEARLEVCVGAEEGTGKLDRGQLEAFAKEMLRRINRTHSAGVSYDRLSRALGVEGVTNIVPDSANAEPLSIQLEVGAFPLPPATSSSSDGNLKKKPLHSSPSRSPLRSPQRQKEQEEGAQAADSGQDWAWGLRARLQTATAYDVYDDAVERKWLGVRVEYVETLCLPFVVVEAAHAAAPAGAGAAAAAPVSYVSLGTRIRMTERQS